MRTRRVVGLQLHHVHELGLLLLCRHAVVTVLNP